jgi:nitroreductase
VDLFEAIRHRRSIRQFADQPIETEHVVKILNAARWAPSGGNQQKWRFVVVTSRTLKEMVRKISPGIFSRPAAFVVVCSLREAEARPWNEGVLLADCAMAAQNILLAAYALGLGSCIALSFSKIALKEILNLPDNVEPEFIITLGYADEHPQPPPRLPLEEIVFAEQYGERWEP